MVQLLCDNNEDINFLIRVNRSECLKFIGKECVQW